VKLRTATTRTTGGDTEKSRPPFKPARARKAVASGRKADIKG